MTIEPAGREAAVTRYVVEDSVATITWSGTLPAPLRKSGWA